MGLVTRITDPRGNATEYAVNQLDEVVRVTSPPVTAGVAHSFVWDSAHDLNGNVVRVDVSNIDDQGVEQSNALLSTVYEYDVLNHVTRMSEEKDEGQSVVTEYQYDANENLSLVRFGEATAGRDLLDVVRFDHDERDLLFRRSGRTQTIADLDELSYDGNGNLATVCFACQSSPEIRQVHQYVNDGYGRCVRATDAMGNVDSFRYDAGDNLVAHRVEGELNDVDGGAGNVLLESTTYEYDAQYKLFSVTGEPSAVGESHSTKRFFYSDAGQVVRVVDDNGHETKYAYDGACRPSAITDALGNTRSFEYDASSNVTRCVDGEPSGGMPIFFQTTFAFDNLDRCVQATDNAGNAIRYGYDSRSNLTRMEDGLGNVTRYAYDGLSRLVSTSRVMPAIPAPGGTGDIVTRCVWDDSSRRIETIDPNGNSTHCSYDSLDRLRAVTMADGTAWTLSYDVHGNPISVTDPNHTVVIIAYDRMHRLTRRSITAGPGVSSDTTFEDYQYDGLSRLVRADDDDSVVTLSYDSLSRMTRETLDGKSTSYTYDGAGNMLSMTYPGGREVRFGYDELDRETSLTVTNEGRDRLRLGYVGPTRIASLEFGNGTHEDLAYDNARRPIRTVHGVIGSDGTLTPFEDRSYEWDAAYRKTARTSLIPGGFAQKYAYDAADRLTQSTRGVLGTPPVEIDYKLDLAGNRLSIAGGPDAGAYALDGGLPEPADLQMNQYTRTPLDGRVYDANGNLTAIQVGGQTTRAFTYDYANRLVLVDDALTHTTSRFHYDALGRRSKHEAAMAAIQNTRRFFYTGSRVIEVEDDAGHSLVIHHHGTGGSMRSMTCCDTDGDGVPDLDYYFHTDDAGNTTAVTDASGAVVERYEYGDYGQPRILNAAGNPLQQSAISNSYLLAGRQLDAETGLYYDGRYFDSRAGQYLTRRTFAAPHVFEQSGRSVMSSIARRKGGYDTWIRSGWGAFGGKKGYDYYKKYKGSMGAAQSNPLYTDGRLAGSNPLYENSGNAGTNPLYQDRQVAGENPFYEGTKRVVSNPLYEESGPRGENPLFGYLISDDDGTLGLTDLYAEATSSDKLLRLKGFKVDIDGAGGKEHDTAWEHVSGGELNIETTETTIGSDKFRTNSPGHKSVSEITLTEAMTYRQMGKIKWFNETAQGRSWKWPAPADGVQYYLHRMSVTNTTGNVMEEVRLKFIRCELK